MFLTEGGNIWAEAKPFDQANINIIKQQLDNYLAPLKVKSIVIGSGATPKAGKISGDLDVLVDLDKLSKQFNSTDPKEIRSQLEKFLQNKHLQTRRIAVTVHVLLPIADSFVQVDIKAVKNAKQVALFHTHDIPKDSPYKGIHKQMLINSLATSLGLLWSPDEGLYNRDKFGKKADLISTDLNQIAKRLLGTAATASDLKNAESILDAIPDEKRRVDILNMAKNSASWKAVMPKETTITEWFRKMMDLV